MRAFVIEIKIIRSKKMEVTKNIADVTIAGGKYTLSGEKTEEKIKEIANYVDEELTRTSEMLGTNPNFKSAVLTCVNMAEKLMDNSDLLLKVQAEKHQLDNDVKHYVNLWESAKRQVTELQAKIGDENDKQVQDDEKYKELEEKCTEMENAYFDLQMENVNLKNEMRSLKKMRG